VWNPQNYEDTDYGLDPDESFEPEDAADAAFDIDLAAPHVMTVLGPIPPDDLGICLHHEHILCDPVAVTREDPDYRLDREDLAAEELEAFVTMSGRGVVDCSTRDYGRDASGLVRVAGQVPVHIIAVTGRHKHLHAGRLEAATDVEALTTEFLGDLQQGMDGTFAKAGVIKVGTSLNEITDVEAATVRAAGAAHRATGAPITTHTEAGTRALEQLDRLGEEGVDPTRVIVGHLDRRMDWEFLLAVAKTGAFVSFDQVGKTTYGADADRAAVLVRLAEAGYGQQLLMSQDFAQRSLLLAYGGQPGLAYLLERFTLELMAAGAEALLVRTMLIENTARALTILPPSREDPGCQPTPV
jgi:phosphotriesterase-related protein